MTAATAALEKEHWMGGEVIVDRGEGAGATPVGGGGICDTGDGEGA